MHCKFMICRNNKKMQNEVQLFDGHLTFIYFQYLFSLIYHDHLYAINYVLGGKSEKETFTSQSIHLSSVTKLQHLCFIPYCCQKL